MLYFQKEAVFIQKERESKIISRVKDNFYKHPKTGFIQSVISIIPQKSFSDVMNALRELDDKFTLCLQEEMSKGKNNSSDWLAHLQLEIDQHNDEFGIDPQQTGNLLRHALRGMIYHHIIESDVYTVPYAEECPWRYIVDFAKRTFPSGNKLSEFSLFKNNRKKKQDYSILIDEVYSVYRRALIHFCSNATSREINVLVPEINSANIIVSANKNKSSLLESDPWAISLTSIRQWTQYSDRYWAYGSLFAIKSVLDALINANELGYFSFEACNVISELSSGADFEIEEKTAIINTGIKTISLLNESILTTC